MRTHITHIAIAFYFILMVTGCTRNYYITLNVQGEKPKNGFDAMFDEPLSLPNGLKHANNPIDPETIRGILKCDEKTRDSIINIKIEHAHNAVMYYDAPPCKQCIKIGKSL